MQCVESGCNRKAWADTPFCLMHLIAHIERSLHASERDDLSEHLDKALKTLTYREREIIKLRTGVGDGYTYTRSEIGRIFKTTASHIRNLEAKALRKLQHPVRLRHLKPLIEIISFDKPLADVVEVVQAAESELIQYVTRKPHILDNIPSDAFERIIGEVFSSSGFEVELTQKTRDGGRDIVAVRTDHLGFDTKYIIECKRYAPDRPVRVEFVRSLYGVKQQERADHAILATTSYFTNDAIKFCRSPSVWNLHLKDRDAIWEWLIQYQKLTNKETVIL